jgi:hypothetical protein
MQKMRRTAIAVTVMAFSALVVASTTAGTVASAFVYYPVMP